MFHLSSPGVEPSPICVFSSHGPGSDPFGWRVAAPLLPNFVLPGTRVAVRWDDGFHRAEVREDLGDSLVAVRRIDHGDEEVVSTGGTVGQVLKTLLKL